MLFKLEGFYYAVSLDLNMVYYKIRLSNNASNLCMIIIPWGGYRYKHLLMVISNSPDIFQQKINDSFHGLEFFRSYIDDLLVLTKGAWKYHVQIL